MFHISKSINKIIKDKDCFNEIIDEVSKCDGIIWAFPVYVLSVPAQLIQFIEHVRKQKKINVFQNKYACSVSTSMHFFDQTAHDYIQAISEDFKLNYVDGFSAEMFDLKKEETRRNLKLFAENYFSYIKKRKPVYRKYQSLEEVNIDHESDQPYSSGSVKETNVKVIVITNADKNDHSLNNMIQVFVSSLQKQILVINVNDLDMKGGCLGCLKCSREGKCIYKDEFIEYKEVIHNARAFVYALKIKERSFGSRWKMFMDRNFSNGHRIKDAFNSGFMISGSLRKHSNIQAIVEGIVQGGRAGFEGNLVTDEDGPEVYVPLIQAFASNLDRAIDANYRKPANFYGVGAHKIFRDLVYSTKGFQVEDHKYYKKQGLYDFPNRDYKMRLTNSIFRLLTMSSSGKKKLNAKINDMMLMTLQKEIEKD
ncbi:MAG: hypothetical protein C0594_17700 [Marinilabiliales bacterium]|nr:MAG: hypothetical protein C0594_17700 [Marinilabiliales bacterium]